MGHYANSDYALNKNNAGIVYAFADGAREITLADFLWEYPGAEPDEFDALKAWSDEDYLKRDRSGYNTTRKDVGIECAGQSEMLRLPSLEESMIADIDAQEECERKTRLTAIAKQALEKLTKVQRRRYQLYFVDGLSERQIAELEGTAQQSISQSLLWAEKKIKKFLSKAKK